MVGNFAMVLDVILRDRLNSADPLLTSRHSLSLTSFRSSHLGAVSSQVTTLPISNRAMTVI